MNAKEPLYHNSSHKSLKKEEALAGSKLRWDVSLVEVKVIEPFDFKNFFAGTFRIERYARMIQEEEIAWIGCRYNPPLIWFPPEDYQRDYQFNKKREDTAFGELIRMNGFREPVN